MVGHTGIIDAAIKAVEAVDECVGRVVDATLEMGGVALITADHGNADEMYETDKQGQPKAAKDGSYKAKTSHTLNPVPCIIYDNTDAKAQYTVKADEGQFGLSNVAATMVNLMGFEAPAMWDASIIDVK